MAPAVQQQCSRLCQLQERQSLQAHRLGCSSTGRHLCHTLLLLLLLLHKQMCTEGLQAVARQQMALLQPWTLMTLASAAPTGLVLARRARQCSQSATLHLQGPQHRVPSLQQQRLQQQAQMIPWMLNSQQHQQQQQQQQLQQQQQCPLPPPLLQQRQRLAAPRTCSQATMTWLLPSSSWTAL
jgi:hypothetical protein